MFRPGTISCQPALVAVPAMTVILAVKDSPIAV
jgi:hypothetical protein